jgi:hypothetical protein
MPKAPSAKHIGNKNTPYQPYFLMLSNIPHSDIARLQQRKLSFSEWKGKSHEDIDAISKRLDEASRNLYRDIPDAGRDVMEYPPLSDENLATRILRLPTELRYIIWAYIWTPTTWAYMVQTLQTSKTLRPLLDKQRPYVIDKTIVGQSIALDVVQAFYSHTSRHASAFEVTDVPDITSRLHEDIFQVELRPSTIIKALNIGLDLEDLPWNQSKTEEMLNKHLPSLLDIGHPQGFQLKLTITCDTDFFHRVDQLRILIDILEPILLECKSKGMRVACVWISQADKYDYVAFRQLSERLVDQPYTEWNEKVLEVLCSPLQEDGIF